MPILSRLGCKKFSVSDIFAYYQATSRLLITAEVWFSPRADNVGFVADKATLVRVVLRALWFPPCQLLFNPCSIFINLPSGGWTVYHRPQFHSLTHHEYKKKFGKDRHVSARSNAS